MRKLVTKEIIYCDRCKKEFEKWNHKRNELIGVGEIIYDNDDPYWDNQKDLCESCYDELEKWWNFDSQAEIEEEEMKTNTHIVIKREDIFKYLTDNQIECLDAILNTIADGRKKDGKKPDNSYYICNTDEPYADEVLDVILKAESEDKE